jgi:hypothetical protein
MQAGSLYKINVGSFVLNSEQSTMSLQSFSVTPVVSEATFSKTHQYQEDLYNLAFKNIRLTGINTKLLVSDKSLDASTMQFEPVIKIYNDRTALPGKESKVGGYPHQLLQQLKLPVSIKNVEVRNGYLAYTEKSIVSGKTGTVFFKNINATINNVTNQKAAINRNNIMELNATTSFMGVSDIRTNWKLPLNSNNGAFEVSGEAGGFDGPSLNKMTVPMAMVAIRKGHFTKISFKMNGDDHGAKGRSTILYEDLKLDVLRKDSNDTKKRGVVSFIANFMVLNNNPQNGNTREGTINQDREVTKSFFNLIWKSVFDAAKRTVSGKKE